MDVWQKAFKILVDMEKDLLLDFQVQALSSGLSPSAAKDGLESGLES